MPTPTPRKRVRSRKEPPGATPSGSSAVIPAHALIARRAYELFLQRGGEHGRDWEDWLTAERELWPSGIPDMVGDLVQH